MFQFSINAGKVKEPTLEEKTNESVATKSENKDKAGAILHMDTGSSCFDLRRGNKTEPKQAQIIQDRKRGTVAVLEKTKKKSTVSTTADKKGGRRK